MFEDSDDDKNEFDNLLSRVGGKQFFENILGGIERQEINSFDSESDSSSSSESESDSSSDESVSPLYGDNSDSDSDSDSDADAESSLFIDEENIEVKEIEKTIEEPYESDDISPFILGEDESLKNKTVADIKKLITDMSKLL